MPDDMSQILNNFKNLMDSNINQSNNSFQSSEDNNSSNNFNITPEMIANLSEVLKNSNFNTSNNSNGSDNANHTGNSTENSNSNSNTSQIDFETILKIKSIMEKLNKKDDPRSNLLYSLKPYLRESRQKKLDEYSNLLKIASMSDLFTKK